MTWHRVSIIYFTLAGLLVTAWTLNILLDVVAMWAAAPVLLVGLIALIVWLARMARRLKRTRRWP